MPFGKWRDFEDRVQDIMKTQGKDEESAKRICAALQKRLGEESFNWTGQIELMYPAKLLRGEAIHPIKTFHPEEWPDVRVYLEEELKKSAETLIGKPLMLDHERVLNGEVLAARYEDGAVEYIAWLNDEEVVDKIRSGKIKHCSIEYDWNLLQKVNGVAPRGIEFLGLSLLEKYQPGDPLSSVEVWEAIIKKLKESKNQSEELIVGRHFPGRIDPVAANIEGSLQAVNNKIDQVRENIQTLQRNIEEVAKKISKLESGDTYRILQQLERKVKVPEKEKDDPTKKLGEAIIEPTWQEKKLKEIVLRELKAIPTLARVPLRWGYQAHEQNRRIKALIRRLEEM